jgi:hypothetical protein
MTNLAFDDFGCFMPRDYRRSSEKGGGGGGKITSFLCAVEGRRGQQGSPSFRHVLRTKLGAKEATG